MPGITTEGFDMPTVEELLASLQERARVEFGAGVNVTATSPLGQLLTIVADSLHTVWSSGRLAYGMIDPDQAEGELLDNIGAFNLAPRQGAVKSAGTISLAGTAGTVVPAGTQFLAPTGPRVATTDEVTLGAGPLTDADVAAVETGEVTLVPTFTFTIVNPIAGLTDATLEAGQEISGGRALELDPSYRARLKLSPSLRSGATDPSIRAAILEVTGVTAAIVISNRTDATYQSIPPGQYRCFVLPNTISEELIAAAIIGVCPAGKGSYGTIEVTAEDSEGYTDTVRFDWMTEVACPVVVQVVTDPRYYVSDEDLEDEITDYITGLSAGEDVGYDKVRGIVATYPGVTTITTCTLAGGAVDVSIDLYAGEIADRTPSVTVTS